MVCCSWKLPVSIWGSIPAPHQNKDLIIRVRHWGGDVQEYSYPERSRVELELGTEKGHQRREGHEWHDRDGDHDRDHDGDHRREEAYERRERGLHVLRADYGAEGQFSDVTEALRSQVNNGQLSLQVNNYTMGGDPVPGARKTLRILYLYDGERRKPRRRRKNGFASAVAGLSKQRHLLPRFPPRGARERV